TDTIEGRRNVVAAANPLTCLVEWRDASPGSLGAPAARGGVVAVPYLHQSMVLLDGRTGDELARVRSRDEEILFARAAPEGFFYGSNKGLSLANSRSASGTRENSARLEARLDSTLL